MTRGYSREFMDRTVRLLADSSADYASDTKALECVARDLGLAVESLRVGGAGLICRTLKASLDCGFLTPRACWQARVCAVSRMRERHEALARDVMMVHAHRFMTVYGYRKTLIQLRRQGWGGIGRDQVPGDAIPGRPGCSPWAGAGGYAARKKKYRWARGSGATLLHGRRPGRLHVADITYVRLSDGSFAYVVFRRRRVRLQDRRMDGILQPAHPCAAAGRP